MIQYKNRKKQRILQAVICLTAACALCACAPGEYGDPMMSAAQAIGITMLQDMPAQADPVPDGKGTVTVSTVDELLDAIASDTRILLEPGEYCLTDAAGYGGESGNPDIRWQDAYDGFELVIQGVSGLELIGADPDSTRIVTGPRYANVLIFQNSSDLTLSGVTLGHTDGPGECSGGVLYLESCDKVSIERCGLFGCGVSGIQAQYSTDIAVSDTHIYDCSYEAADLYFCKRVVFRNCTVDHLGSDEIYSAWSVLSLSSCSDIALVNSEVSSCLLSNFLVSSGSRRVSILGCGIENNTFSNAVFYIYGNGPTVEGCGFRDNSYFNWYEVEGYSSYACSEDGSVLDAGALAGMQRREMEYTLPESAVAGGTALNERVDANGMRTVYAETVNEFLAAIGPNTVIYLTGAEYRLEDADGYGADFESYYHWEQVYDGYELVLTDLDNLTITGTGALVSALPRYANVLTFSACTNLKLSGVTFGHVEAPGECAGGVLRFLDCQNVELGTLRLFGCGVLGIEADAVTDMEVTGCEIHDCSYGGVSLFGSRNILFRSCYLHDNEGPDFYVDGSCSEIYADGMELDAGFYGYEAGSIQPEIPV